METETMMRCRWFCWILLGGLGLLGCDTTSATPDADLPALVQPTKAAAAKASPATTTGRRASAKADRSPMSPKAQEPEFKPPFPPRENPFTLPPRGTQPVPSPLPGISETPLRVLLKGFVALDAPRAVLTIDDEVVSLGVGEEHRGVKVLALAPPQVTLQRGRYRWTESLQQASSSAK